jgi:inosine/xanthosine triphosphate pyrophosphatase family protein
MSIPTLNDFVVVTSNAQKIAEYARFAGDQITVQPGQDLPEVLGTPDEIIIHKALMAGPGMMVEDAIMWIDGEAHVDVKWKIPSLLAGEYPLGVDLLWEVRLAVLHQGKVYAYLGQTKGKLQEFDGSSESMGMDPVFKVDELDATLAKLALDGRKDAISARRLAAVNVIEGTPYLTVNADDVAPWSGPWQNE